MNVYLRTGSSFRNSNKTMKSPVELTSVLFYDLLNNTKLIKKCSPVSGSHLNKMISFWWTLLAFRMLSIHNICSLSSLTPTKWRLRKVFRCNLHSNMFSTTFKCIKIFGGFCFYIDLYVFMVFIVINHTSWIFSFFFICISVHKSSTRFKSIFLNGFGEIWRELNLIDSCHATPSKLTYFHFR